MRWSGRCATRRQLLLCGRVRGTGVWITRGLPGKSCWSLTNQLLADTYNLAILIVSSTRRHSFNSESTTPIMWEKSLRYMRRSNGRQESPNQPPHLHLTTKKCMSVSWKKWHSMMFTSIGRPSSSQWLNDLQCLMFWTTQRNNKQFLINFLERICTHFRFGALLCYSNFETRMSTSFTP